MPQILEYNQTTWAVGRRTSSRIAGALLILVVSSAFLASSAAGREYRNFGEMAYGRMHLFLLIVATPLAWMGVHRLLRVSEFRIDRSTGDWSMRAGWWPFVRARGSRAGRNLSIVAQQGGRLGFIPVIREVLYPTQLVAESSGDRSPLRVTFSSFVEPDDLHTRMRFHSDYLAEFRRGDRAHPPSTPQVKLRDDPVIADLLRQAPANIEARKEEGRITLRRIWSRVERRFAMATGVVTAIALAIGLIWGLLRVGHIIFIDPEFLGPIGRQPDFRAALVLGAAAAGPFLVLWCLAVLQGSLTLARPIDNVVIHEDHSRHMRLADLPLLSDTKVVPHADILAVRLERGIESRRHRQTDERHAIAHCRIVTPFVSLNGGIGGDAKAATWLQKLFTRIAELRSPIYRPDKNTSDHDLPPEKSAYASTS